MKYKIIIQFAIDVSQIITQMLNAAHDKISLRLETDHVKIGTIFWAKSRAKYENK